MKIQIQSIGYPLSVSKKLVDLIQQEVDKSDIDTSSGVTINFRDPDYSAESGGYHPVEIAVDEHGRILYITDFAYYGSGPYAELDKEIDFDFSYNVFQHMRREFPIARGAELFELWQSNFCDYVARQAFEVSISSR